MLDQIQSLDKIIRTELSQISDSEALEKFRLEYLVKKGKIQELFDKLKDIPKAEKPLFGKELNLLRNFTETEYKNLKDKFDNLSESIADIDLTLPGRKLHQGSTHPVNQTLNEMIKIFESMGFAVVEGPDIEDGFHNFDALNFPPNHPARDMQDTFFVKSDKEYVLRTHTSPVQIRAMLDQKPPIRCIMPGRVYRNESINSRSLAEFHQIEGLYIDKNVTLAELKSTIISFAKKMYGEHSKFRFRPSFFPFTEPSAEMDISCYLCGGKGCRICKHSGWLEIVGCGMVHPNVLKNCGIDPDVYSGYAFGFGLERVTLLRNGVDDIRLYYENDNRFLKQF